MLANGSTTMERRGGPDRDGGTLPHGAASHGVDPHGPRDVLQRLLAAIRKFRLDAAADMLIGRSRNADAAGFGDPFEPRGDVDAVADQVVALDDHVAKVDADTVDETPLNGNASVALGRHPLNCECAFDRRDDGREFDEDAVAHRLEDAPAVGGDDRRRRLAQVPHRFRRSRLVLAHQARVADDVAGEDGGKLARGGRFHPFTAPAGRIAGRACCRPRRRWPIRRRAPRRRAKLASIA